MPGECHHIRKQAEGRKQEHSIAPAHHAQLAGRGSTINRNCGGIFELAQNTSYVQVNALDLSVRDNKLRILKSYIHSSSYVRTY